MNVLHLISSEGFYGAENVVASLAMTLRQMDHSVHVGVFVNEHCPRNNTIEEMRKLSLDVHPIQCEGRLDHRALCSIRGLLRDTKTQLLHTHVYKADIYGYLAAVGLSLPLISTCHLWTRHSRLVRIYESLDSLVLRGFDKIVAVSDPIAQQLRQTGIPVGKVVTIDNGIDLSRFSASHLPQRAADASGPLVVGTVGRLVSQKGMDYFLGAARQILDQKLNVLFKIVGDGPDRAGLERLASRLGIADRVIFTGGRDDMPLIYPSFDIFVLASVDEGLPMVVLEAMASGLPVVTTTVGALPKVVDSGVTGLLVPPRDATALANAILSLLESAYVRQQMGILGKVAVQEYSSWRMTLKYLSVYEGLLTAAGARDTDRAEVNA